MANQSVKSLVVALLLQSGFEEAGLTRPEQARVPTTSAPVFGHGRNPPGGELRSFGGRQRFHRGRWYVTVGSYTTSFYTRMEDTSPGGFKNFVTQDLDKIAAFVETILSEEVKGS